MASASRQRLPVDDDSDRRNPNSKTSGNSSRTVAVPAQQPAGPIVWSALGRVAGTAWTGIKLCHRYVLAPATMWILNQLREYIEEQLAIRKAMGRPCPAPVYGEQETRQATEDLGFTRRALGTPYGMVVYLTQLRGKPVAVRQVPLHRLRDVDAFWEEASAGRALLAAGRHANVVLYAGCCPALACHVYEQRPGTCSLRDVLLQDSPYGTALGSWEIRVALCRQLMSAVVHLLRLGVCARKLSAAHVIFSLGGCDSGGGDGSSRAGGSSSGPADRGPCCWLAPGCAFRLREAAAGAPPQATSTPQRQRQSQQQQQPMTMAEAARRCGGRPSTAGAEERAGPEERPGEEFVSMSRALGQLMFQVVAGADSPVPPASAVLTALSDMVPTRLLSASAAGISPPLPDEPAWKLFATIYSLVKFDGAAHQLPPPGQSAAAAASSGRGVARGAADGGGARGAAGGGDGGRAAGPSSECGRALLRHLVQEAVPALEEVQFQIRWAATPAATAPTPPPVAPSPRPPANDAFADASAPPLPQPAPAASPATPVADASAPPAPSAAVTAGSVLSPGPVAAAPAYRTGPAEELLCPITTDLMEDPVVAADGHSYERAAITRWLASRHGRPTSPLTGAVLPHTNLTPNYALRKIIADWREQHM